MIAGRGRGRGIVNTKKREEIKSPGGLNQQPPNAKKIESDMTVTFETIYLRQYLLSLSPDSTTHDSKSPDPTPPVATVSINDVIACMNNLGLEARQKNLDDLTTVARKYATSPEYLKQVVSLLYKRSFSDPDYSEAIAKAVGRLWSLEVDGGSFKRYILAMMQSDFKVKDELRTTSEDKFIAFVSFLCQMFIHVRTEAGEPFHVLIDPIVQCAEMIVNDGSHHEIECCSQQLQTVGALLEHCKDDALENLFLLIRRRIISNKHSTRVSSLLLELLEVRLNRWQPLAAPVSQLYVDYSEFD